MKDGNQPYQAASRSIAYMLQESLNRELDRLQKKQIKVLLDVVETLEWCNGFFQNPKANGKVWLCLDLARLDKVLIRPVHIGPRLNDILMRLAGVKYHTLIDASSGNHDLKLDEKPSYLTTFSCPLGRMIYAFVIWSGSSRLHVQEEDR